MSLRMLMDQRREKLARWRALGVDTLGYLSHDGLLACEQDGQAYCTACFTGRYPVAVLQTADEGQFKLFEKAVGG